MAAADEFGPTGDHRGLVRELNRARRHERSCAVITIEARHPAVLAAIGGVLPSLLREHDVVAGGHCGWIVLAPDTDVVGGRALLLRISEALRPTLEPTSTLSLATFPDDGVTLEALIDNVRPLRPEENDRIRTRSESVSTDRLLYPRRARGLARARRLIDIVVALAGLAVLAPGMVVVAIAIRLDSPGPVFYRQVRTGRNGSRFVIWKFRSMTCDADERKAEVAALNRLDAANFKVEHDPRVTRVGQIIRRLSIDELPQLINVVQGDMALVGPRPTWLPPEQHELWQTERLDVLPGLTGTWQVTRRGTTLFAERCRMEIRYARIRDTALDLKILASTVPAVVVGRGVT